MGNTIQTQSKFRLQNAFLNNEEVVIKAFYLDEYPKTKHYVLSHGGQISNAEDVFQEAFFAFWKKICTGKFCPNSRPEMEAYLFTAARNKWIDEMRLASRNGTISLNETFIQVEDDQSLLDTENEEREYKLNITLKAFENLGKDCKALLTQFYYNKVSLKEIAQNLNIEETSAKNKKYRCIQKLKELAKQ